MPDAPKRMSPERIELIRKKADECGLFDRAFTTSEVAYLLAEIDVLRAENARLAAENICLTVEARKLAAECEAARARLTPHGVAYLTVGPDTPSQPNAVAYAEARAATDASGALARHGGVA